MSFLGGPLAGAAGGAITPASGLGMAGGPLSGLGALGALFGGGKEKPEPSAAASGLGKLIGTDPSRIGEIADRIGKGMNGIAAGGGAAPGYAAPELPQAPANHMQLLDNAVLQRIMQQFGGQPGMQR